MSVILIVCDVDVMVVLFQLELSLCYSTCLNKHSVLKLGLGLGLVYVVP